jgi:sarcosine oxidase, subunit beta
VEESRAEVLVLGAGIAGAALAHHLAERRVGPVTLYDPHTPAAGATGRAAGIVTEQLWDRWDVQVVRECKEEYARLAARWDRSAYAENGFVRWTRDPAIAAALAEARERLGTWGVRVDFWSPTQIASHLPWVRPDGIACATSAPGDGVVTPSTMTEIYAGQARRAGVDLWLGTPLTSFRAEAGGWRLETGGRTLRAKRAVVAAGAWSKRLLASISHPLPLCPYRTQAAVLLPPPPSPESFPSVHDLDVDVYARPEAQGRILAGDGTERVEADPDAFQAGADDGFVGHLAESFESRFPGWRDSELVRAWAGVCTATPDRRPLIGPVPGATGLYVIAGFNGFGVMRAAGAARRLADLISDPSADRANEALASVRPGRFGPSPPNFTPKPGFTLESGDDPRF